METVIGLVVIAVVVAVVRAAMRSGSTSAPPWTPPGAGSSVGQPTGPRTPSASGRQAEFPPESVDDAFAVGFVMGRQFGHDAEPSTPAYVEDAHDTYVGDDDWGGGWSDDGGGDE